MSDSPTNENLSAYLDGELSEVEAAELERRLAREPELRGELDSLRSAIELLQTHGPLQAPAGFYGAVLRRVEQEPDPRPWWARFMRPMGLPIQGLAVALVAIVVVAIAVPWGQEGVSGAPTESLAQDRSAAAAGQAPERTKGEAEVATDGQSAANDAEASPVTDGVADANDGAEGTAEEAVGIAEQPGSYELAKGAPSKLSSSKSLSIAPDQGTAEGVVQQAGSSRRIALETDDPNVLRALQRFLDGNGGRLLDLNGRPLKVHTIGGGTEEIIHAAMPSNVLYDFEKELKRHGVTSTHEEGDLSGGEHMVRLTIRMANVQTDTQPATYDDMGTMRDDPVRGSKKARKKAP